MQPQYYILPQQPLDLSAVSFTPADVSIFVKEFDIGSDLETAKIAIFEDGINIKYYNYHQWTGTLNEVLTDYSITRMSKYGLFGKGIAKSIYTVSPDFILECKVLDCAINQYTGAELSNNVEISIEMTLMAVDKINLTYVPVFVKTYNKTQAYSDDSLQSAIKTLSVSLSNILDLCMIDIFQQI